MSKSCGNQLCVVADRFIATRQEALRFVVRMVAITCFCMAIGGYVGYSRLGEAVGHPAFLSPYFSTVVLVCGLLLYAAHTHTRCARLVALIVVAAITGAHIAPRWFEVWQNGRQVSAFFGSGVVLLGALAALLMRHDAEMRGQRKVPGAAAVVLLSIPLSTAIAYALIEGNTITQQRFAVQSAELVALDVKERIAHTSGLMTRLGERWGVIDHVPTRAFMGREFGSYTRDFPYFKSIALINKEGAVVGEVRRDNGLSWKPGAGDTVLDRYEPVYANDVTRFAVQGHTGAADNTGLVITPLSNPGMAGWFIVARIDLGEMFAPVMSRTGEAYYRISHGRNVLYQTAGQPPAKPFISGDVTFSAEPDLDLTLSYVYARGPVDISSEILPELVLLAGMLFTFFLVSSQKLAFIARERSVQLHQSALHDPLTGLPNRRMLEQTLMEARAGGGAENLPVSVVFLDLDGIKLINDSAGHDVGDGVLVEVAHRLQRRVQKQGSVTRLGGDEFVLLFFGLGLQQVQELTERVILDLSRPYHVKGKVLRVTASGGIATSDGQVKDHMQLVREADLAMLKAKQKGRNTWHAYTVDLSARVAERLELRNDLQTALEQEGLELHYQPIVSGSSGQVIGLEALVRWPHPTRGYISPTQFIPSAEETGQIIPLTEWVLATACRDCGSLREQGFSAFPVIVNISPMYFQRVDFVQSIRKTLEAAALPAEFLEIEITEGVLIDSGDDAILKLEQLRDMGVKTSIDDFGTGYSSLNYLKNLPIDKVKIDRSFIIDVVSDPADAAIVQGIISMAHHLGLKVVAEGVETEAQYSFLTRSHCDAFQGYLFSKPTFFNALVATFGQSGARFLPSQPIAEPPAERVLLLIDDERNILNALTRLLRRDGYRILTANGPAQAFEVLAKHAVQVIVCDQRMPEMTGTEFFSRVKDMYPATMRMILSGYTELKSVTEAINRGAICKFLTKPWDDGELRKEIEQAFINQRAIDSQEILNIERERLRRLFQQAPGFVCMLRGPEHVFELANDAYYQLVGHRQIMGRALADALPEIAEQGYLEQLNRVFTTGKPFNGRALPIQLQRVAGGDLEQCYVDMIYQPIRDAGGRISGIFVQGYDVTETHILAKKVAHDAAHDSVTGLLNRREFERRWDEIKGLAGPHAILYIDLDHFRTIKNRVGRAAGDEVLQQVATILQQHLKETDLLATVGGDQFAAALPGTATKDALDLTHKLCLAVRETQFAWGDNQYSVTLSIGLAEFQNLETISFTEALGIADAACCLAKENGRDRVYVYHGADLLTAE